MSAPARVAYWWDWNTSNWCIQLLDKEGNQINDAKWEPNRKLAKATARSWAKEHKIESIEQLPSKRPAKKEN